MTAVERATQYFVWAIAGFTVVFLMTPLIVTIAVSFGSSTVFTLPPPDWSLRWYERLAGMRGLVPALLVSLQIAAVSTAVAMVLGTLCAIALVRGRFPGRETISTFLVSPLMLPGLVIGIAMLQGFKAMGLRDVYASLLVAHVVITLPYIVRTVVGALSLFDFSLNRRGAHAGLLLPGGAHAGAGAVARAGLPDFGHVRVPASMDNYPISMFFTDAWTKTLPIQMLQYVEERPDPTIAAISAGLVLLAILALIIGDRLVGLRKLADF